METEVIGTVDVDRMSKLRRMRHRSSRDDGIGGLPHEAWPKCLQLALLLASWVEEVDYEQERPEAHAGIMDGYSAGKEILLSM